jgi:CarboxypepD_reg-like domain/TonB-dependent Receptor Plug Domain
MISSMKNRLNWLKLLWMALFGLVGVAAMAQNAIIRGTVVDGEGNPVPGANVVIPSLRVGSTANGEGIFSISKLTEGTYQVRATFIGFDTLYKEVTLTKNQVVTIALKIEVSGTFLDDIVIQDNATGKIKKRELEVGVETITPEKINLLPSLGTPDLAQYLQILPGVLSTGDQGGQVYIRGGTPIQNMVLLDGAIVYSPFHSIGLFSVFDTDYIRDVEVYSAAFPAKYGGRISSIMDITTRNGNYRNLSVKAHMNPITAGFLMEGPFRKQKGNETKGSSFLLSARHNSILTCQTATDCPTTSLTFMES